MARTAVGTVGYLNARPLADGIDRERWDVHSGTPAQVAAALVAGEVALALVPVAAILDGGDWRVVPGVCIGADGPVDSVLLVSEVPPEAWTEVLLDGESRTSAVLTRLLLRWGPLADRVGARTIAPIEPGTGVARAVGTAASLVIGDAALDLPDRLTTRIDLAACWKEWTGLPFVFAVWAGRPGVDPDLVAHLRMVGRAGVEAIGERWSGAERLYLQERIRYQLDDPALMGLRRFAATAREAGFLSSEDIQIYGPTDTIPRPEGIDALLERAVDGECLGFDDALRLEVAAPLTSLAAAADLKRAELGRGSVGYRLGWKGSDPTQIDAAVRAGATEIHLPRGSAFDGAQWPGVRFLQGADAEVAVVTVGAGESGADRVRALLALRDSGSRRVQVIAADHPGKPAASEANTAVDHLRAVALARLLLNGVQLEASAGTEGIGMAQTSLRTGCDHLGTIFPTEPLERWPDAVQEIERQIRDAGFAIDP